MEARYRIVIQGEIPDSWKGRLAGMTFVDPPEPRGDRATILEGRIRDRAELSGVLDTLYHLHATILRVERLDEETDSGTPVDREATD